MPVALLASNITPLQTSSMLAGAVLAGLAAGWLAFRLLAIAQRDPTTTAQSWDFEARRKIQLRDGSLLFRWFEPLIDELSELPFLQRVGQSESVESSLRQGGSALPWRASEFVGTAAMQGIITGLAVALVVSRYTGSVPAIILAPVVAIFTLWMSAGSLRKEAQRRMVRFKQRLPFAIDLMALMLEAGGDFRQCLTTVVNENQQHPVGDEFGRLLKGVSAGQPLRESLEQVQSRLRDEDINEIVFSVKNAEELGTPLSKTFLTLAEQMRLKRSQTAEKLVGQAQTMMTFPGMIIMIACLLITVAPFVLAAIGGSYF